MFYVATEDLIGYPECPPDENIEIKKGDVLMQTYFDLYHLEYLILHNNKTVCLNRIRVCDDVTNSHYYDNYLAPVKGLIPLNINGLKEMIEGVKNQLPLD